MRDLDGCSVRYKRDGCSVGSRHGGDPERRGRRRRVARYNVCTGSAPPPAITVTRRDAAAAARTS